MYLCVKGMILPVSTIILLDFGTVPTVWYFLFHFIIQLVPQFQIREKDCWYAVSLDIYMANKIEFLKLYVVKSETSSGNMLR